MLTDRPAALNTNYTAASGGFQLLAASGYSFPKGKIRLRLKYPHINKEICIYEQAATAGGCAGLHTNDPTAGPGCGFCFLWNS